MSDYQKQCEDLKSAAEICGERGEGLIDAVINQQATIERQQQEIEDLKEDLAKFAEINSEIATELMALRNPWVSVDERLPEDGKTVLIGHWAKTQEEPNGEWLWIASGDIEDGKWACDWHDDTFEAACFHTVTHWMLYHRSLNHS